MFASVKSCLHFFECLYIFYLYPLLPLFLSPFVFWHAYWPLYITWVLLVRGFKIYFFLIWKYFSFWRVKIWCVDLISCYPICLACLWSFYWYLLGQRDPLHIDELQIFQQMDISICFSFWCCVSYFSHHSSDKNTWPINLREGKFILVRSFRRNNLSCGRGTCSRRGMQYEEHGRVDPCSGRDMLWQVYALAASLFTSLLQTKKYRAQPCWHMSSR